MTFIYELDRYPLNTCIPQVNFQCQGFRSYRIRDICLHTYMQTDRHTGTASSIKLWDITSLGSVQVVGFFDVAARICTGDGLIEDLLGTARSFLCCDESIQVTFPSSILSDYVHMKARCVFMVSVLCVRNCLVQRNYYHAAIYIIRFFAWLH